MIPQGGEVGIKPENGYRSISTPEILNKNEVDTFSYLNVGFFDTRSEAENLRPYVQVYKVYVKDYVFRCKCISEQFYICTCYGFCKTLDG